MVIFADTIGEEIDTMHADSALYDIKADLIVLHSINAMINKSYCYIVSFDDHGLDHAIRFYGNRFQDVADARLFAVNHSITNSKQNHLMSLDPKESFIIET